MLFAEPIGFKNSCGVKATLESISYYPYHMHEDILEIICIINGSYDISVDVHNHTLSYGDIYFFNTRNSHKIKKANGNCIILTVHIDLNHYKDYFRDFDGSGSFDISEQFFICDSFQYENKYSLNTKHLRFLMAKIYMEYSSENASNHRLENLTREFLSHILTHYRNYIYARLDDGTYAVVQHDNISGSERIYRIIDYIYSHFSEKLTLADIAGAEFLNPSYLSTYIKQASGLTFTELLSLARCEAAERLLGNTSKTLDEIAREVGFSTRNHLTNQFKKWFCKTPSQYRRDIIADLSEDSTIQFDSFDYEFAMLIMNSYLDGY